ncbi:PAS domain S-box protein [Maribellus comscasis]|uniref:histidine kinase n=1 Tax=Maribellus comscasis TaxID=2681766 RepID=A0A6I6K2F6_9BACT|nr:PAS domain S-box protein [Maribellus comscasis]QGY44094.1 PAS domain S-box protein [Maribellus comscasis]
MKSEATSMEQLWEENKVLKARISELEKYKAFFEKAPMSYQSLNEDGVFVDINPTWLKTLGYKKEEVVGKKFSEFLHPDWKTHFYENFPAFKKRGYVHDVIFKLRHKKGHFIHISFEGCIAYNPDGSFKQTYCVFQDITKRIETEEKSNKSIAREKVLADILRNSPLAFALGYPDGSIELFNKAFEDLTGYSEEELRGISWNVVLTPQKWRNKEEEILSELCLAKKQVRYEKEYIHKSGRIIPVELYVKAKFNESGDLVHLFAFVTDITDRRKNTDELELHRKNLETIVEERTKKLQEKNKELDKALKVFVGREMLIKELQNKVKTLEDKL